MTCYYPDGQPGEGLIPCNTTAGAASHCCRQGDICISNGFCFSAGLNALVRRGCTDPEFQSTECPQACLVGESGNYSTDVILTPCDTYTSFCCGQNEAARNCCNTDNGTVRIPAGSAIGLQGADPVTTATVTATPSCTPSTLASPASCQSEETAAIGAGAGLGAGLLLTAAFAGLFLYKWRAAERRLVGLGLE